MLMLGLPGGERILMINWAVLIQYWIMMDRRMNGQPDRANTMLTH